MQAAVIKGILATSSEKAPEYDSKVGVRRSMSLNITRKGTSLQPTEQVKTVNFKKLDT